MVGAMLNRFKLNGAVPSCLPAYPSETRATSG
jgi:hypothetical protein